jgi:hypothetical protein
MDPSPKEFVSFGRIRKKLKKIVRIRIQTLLLNKKNFW